MNGKYRINLQKSSDERTNKHGAPEFWTRETCPRWKVLEAALAPGTVANKRCIHVTSETAESFTAEVTGGVEKRSKPSAGAKVSLPAILTQSACVKAEREAVNAIPERGWNEVFAGFPLPGNSYSIDGANPAGHVEFQLTLDSTLNRYAGYSVAAAAFRAPWSQLLTLCRDLTECGIEFQAEYKHVPAVPGFGRSHYSSYRAEVPARFNAVLTVSDREDTNKRLADLATARRDELVAVETEYWAEMRALARERETSRKPEESAWTPTEIRTGDSWRPKIRAAELLTGTGLAVVKLPESGYGRSERLAGWYVVHAESGATIHSRPCGSLSVAKQAAIRVRDGVHDIDWTRPKSDLDVVAQSGGAELATRLNELVAA